MPDRFKPSAKKIFGLRGVTAGLCGALSFKLDLVGTQKSEIFAYGKPSKRKIGNVNKNTL
jgi:hypothetical protein